MATIPSLVDFAHMQDTIGSGYWDISVESALLFDSQLERKGEWRWIRVQ
jgi:hypothetical protein